MLYDCKELKCLEYYGKLLLDRWLIKQPCLGVIHSDGSKKVWEINVEKYIPASNVISDRLNNLKLIVLKEISKHVYMQLCKGRIIISYLEASFATRRIFARMSEKQMRNVHSLIIFSKRESIKKNTYTCQ